MHYVVDLRHATLLQIVLLSAWTTPDVVLSELVLALEPGYVIALRGNSTRRVPYTQCDARLRSVSSSLKRSAIRLSLDDTVL